jgi:two-component system sensor histidine kinase MprB
MSRQQQQRLVMDASHELRTPLTSLRTNVDLLRRAKSMSGDDRDEVMDDVSRELDELSSLVAELVELSTSSRRPDEPVGPIDLGLIAANVAQRAERRFGRTLNVTTAGVVELDGYGSLIERAVWNLVDNAVKFSQSETEIDLAVDGGRVQVRDRGPGISEADRGRVFDRFYRAVETRSEPGSGLGLSIVADIVAAHNGTTFVDEPHDGPGAIVGFEITGVAWPDRPPASGVHVPGPHN